MFNIQKWFSAKSEKELIHDYLASSVSLADLERRQRNIERGDAPWQARAKANLRSWA